MKATTESTDHDRRISAMRSVLPAVIVTATMLLIIDHWDQFDAKEFALLVVIAVAANLEVFLRLSDVVLRANYTARQPSMHEETLEHGTTHRRN